MSSHPVVQPGLRGVRVPALAALLAVFWTGWSHGQVLSDDFDTCSALSSQWTIVDPIGDGVVSTTGGGTGDAFLEIALPSGPNHDVWADHNATVRALQDATDDDFTVELAIKSTPTETYQELGLLVDGAGNNSIIFDFWSGGGDLHVFAAIFENGVAQVPVSQIIPFSSELFIRVTRSGDNWSYEYSADGSVWTLAANFNHAINVERMGPFAANSAFGSASPAFTARFDYFEISTDPIVDEDMGASGETFVVDVLVTGDGTVIQDPDLPTYACGDDVTLTATPGVDSVFVGWTGDVSSSANPLTVPVTSDLQVTAVFGMVGGPNVSGIDSDDFNDCELDPFWTIVDPIGNVTTSIQGSGSGDAHLVFDVPTGGHDYWVGYNRAVRATQPSNDTNFAIQAKFDTIPSQRYQEMGFFVEESASEYIAFSVWADNSSVHGYVASFSGPTVDVPFDVTFTPGASLYLRVERTLDLWTFQHSADGVAWTTFGTYERALTVSDVSVFAANSSLSGSAPAWRCEVDYFFNEALPIALEDDPSGVPTTTLTLLPTTDGSISSSPDQTSFGCGESVTLTAVPAPGYLFTGWTGDASGLDNPLSVSMDVDRSIGATFQEIVAGDVTGLEITAQPGGFLATWQTPEPATSRVEFGTTSALGSSFLDPTLKTSHSVLLSGLEANQPYELRVVSESAGGSVFDTDPQTVVTLLTPTDFSGLVSDDFLGCGLDQDRWGILEPLGDATIAVANTGSDFLLAVDFPAGAAHDVWWDHNTSARVLQQTANGNFEFEAKFDSVPNQRYQEQGIIISQNETRSIIFDVWSDDSNLYVYAVSFFPTSATVQILDTIPTGDDIYLRVRRQANDWTMLYSYDGENWVIAGSFTDAINAAVAGFFVSHSSAGGGAPAFAARVDYFENLADPIESEDLGSVDFSPILTTAVEGEGQVVVTPDLATFECGDIVTVQAIPDPGWQFVGWEGDFAAPENPLSFAIDRDATLTARFEELARLRSDDFNSPNLSGRRWQFDDPLADAVVRTEGSGTGQAEFVMTIPGGDSHNVWATFDRAPKLLQEAPNSDFEIEALFTSPVDDLFDEQGLWIEQEDGDALLVEVYRSETNPVLLAVSFRGGSATIHFSEDLPEASTFGLRLNRTGNLWTVSWQTDGGIWTPAAGFTHVMDVTQAGIMGANTSTSSAGAPEHEVRVDYFFDTAVPIDPEDDGAPADIFGPFVYHFVFVPGSDILYLSLDTDEPARVFVDYGVTPGLEMGTVSTEVFATDHRIAVEGLIPEVLYYYQVRVIDALGNETALDVLTEEMWSIAGDATLNYDIWYGPNQQFGQIGRPQRQVNILGNLDSFFGLKFFNYSLNGVPYRPLSRGPDARRLEFGGDFNVELFYEDLQPGINHVLLVTEDNTGRNLASNIYIDVTLDQEWPLPYTGEWGTVTRIDEISQVVDGLWELTPDGVRTVEVGYDRLIGMGDVNWTDYEMTVPVTLHSVDPDGRLPVWDEAGVDIVFRWIGHYDWNGDQPTWGWWPLGASVGYTAIPDDCGPRLRLSGNQGTIRDEECFVMDFDVPHMFKLRVENVASGVQYQFKAWVQGDPEPVDWQLQTIEGFDDPQEGRHSLPRALRRRDLW